MSLSSLMGPPFRKANWNISFHYKEQIAAFTQHTQSCAEMGGVRRDDQNKEKKSLEWFQRKLGWFHFSLINPWIHSLVKGRQWLRKLMLKVADTVLMVPLHIDGDYHLTLRLVGTLCSCRAAHIRTFLSQHANSSRSSPHIGSAIIMTIHAKQCIWVVQAVV